MKAASVFFFFLSFAAFADLAYKIPEVKFRDREGHEIQNFPLVRTQDGVGLCYAFSATQVLNHYVCKRKNLDCSNAENQLSVLEVGSYYDYSFRVVDEGGDPATVLSNLRSKRVSALNSEACLPFEKLAHQDPSNEGNKQGAAYEELKSIYSGLKPGTVSYEDKVCKARRIKEILPLSKNLSQIMQTFEAYSLEEFVYQVAVKDECSSRQKLEIPPYHVHKYPKRGSNPTYKENIRQLEKLLLNDIPVTLSFCASDFYTPGQELKPGGQDSCEGHAVTIAGIKEVCSFSECKTLLKVHNSYGQSWQDHNNDGWLEARPLLDRTGPYKAQGFLSYVTGHGNENLIPMKKLKRSEPIASRANGNAERDENDAMPGHIDRERNPIFKCDGGYFGDKWLPGKNCRLFRYSN